MKESHTEGPASHGDPESCEGARKDSAEALTGAHAGGVSSREIRRHQGADAVDLSGRQHTRARQRERAGDPARSKNSSTRGNSTRKNPENPHLTSGSGPGGGAAKVEERNAAMD